MSAPASSPTGSNPKIRRRQTKVVATLGPASGTIEVIRDLVAAGADVFRLNFSHGSHEEHRARFDMLRQVETETGRPIAVMADLQGPKLRISTFAEGAIDLVEGQTLRLDLSKEPGDTTRVGLPHPEIFAALQPNTDVLLDDGRVRLHVVSCAKDHAVTTVVSGRGLSNRKGVNVPDVVLPLSALTAKDRKDLAFALDLGVDWVALSFVQRPEDLIEARGLIGDRAGLLAKIEKPQAIDCLSAIIELADGVMVARGDLGVEMRPEDVPTLQKRIVREARQAGKPVIVATQMLESMVTNPAPTRAEASDVATAVFDGADAVMLSAETAAGAYPVAAVAIMDSIAQRVEHDPLYRQIIEAQRLPFGPETSSDAITHAAKQVAGALAAKAIITFTATGSTTLRVTRERPGVPVLCVTPDLIKTRKLMLAYGVLVIPSQLFRRFQDKVNSGVALARELGIATFGDTLVVTAGEGVPGSTNLLRIVTVGEASF
ncbi:pyruvate kinase [Pleomorphomonas diazotrophica]|uniref:Pyruvate kinase n=1 Tax=Pleomorphomonas diazotrophica TaxID=1166257 RepID=A0A1I4UBG1_9HYPH|nr:pyruvate kinase [Pleomorphomonas diazotrophica]PKR91311.1 pyruvate kinase [Pleomorphomonas diazotrophica]SFM86317.1 pyruvate kinase [Pleomorphomonas diazotrophica]